MARDGKFEGRWLAALGAGLIVFGLAHSQSQNGATSLDKGLMAGGGVLLLAAAALSYRKLVVFFGQRSSRLGTNTVTVTALVLVVLALLNFLGYRHHKRYDWTADQLYTLSDQSRRIAGGLKQDVEFLRFEKTADSDFEDLAAEYANLNAHVHYREVDPEEQPEIAREYGVTKMNQTVVSSGGHHAILDGSGEQDLTDGILQATRGTVKTICFLAGHGERSVSSAEPDAYSSAAAEIKSEGYRTEDVNLVSAGDVPSDCNVLLDAGPRQSLFPEESQRVAQYLDGGGKALLLIDPETDPKVDSVLGTWNIRLGTNVVIDASGAGQMYGTGPAIPLVVDYGNSEVTQGLGGTMTFFPLARTVSIASKYKTQPEDTELLKTSARSFTIPSLKTKEVTFDPATDTPGPLSLGVAAERRSVAATDGGAPVKDARLIVIGNSSFAANQWFSSQRNGDLFMNAINWLAQDEDLISIRPKSPSNRRVLFTEMQQRELVWFNLFLVPGIVILSGAFVWMKLR